MSKQRNKAVSLPVIEPNAAGIEVGATEVFVAVPADRNPDPIRSFPTFTVDLERLADWLQQCQIRTVAMKSTGVYWIPLFQILENRKIDVRLVGAITLRTYRAGRPTFPIAGGFSTFMPWVCCAAPFVPTTKSARSVPCGVIATTSFSWQLFIVPIRATPWLTGFGGRR
jgi:hypothetical protein